MGKIQAKLKINAPQLHGKLVKCPEQIFDNLFWASNIIKQVTYCVCNIGTQYIMQSARMFYLLHLGDNADLFKYILALSTLDLVQWHTKHSTCSTLTSYLQYNRGQIISTLQSALTVTVELNMWWPHGSIDALALLGVNTLASSCIKVYTAFGSEKCSYHETILAMCLFPPYRRWERKLKKLFEPFLSYKDF